MQLKDYSVKFFKLDLLKDSIDEKIRRQTSEDGGFDIVVHNAGIADDAAFYFMTPDQWHSVLNVSLNSFFFINKACLAHMIEKKWGRIITITSISGEAGNRGQVNYSAAKGAMISATKALAKEVGRKGVLVNSVSPGLIETEMTKDLPPIDFKQMIPVGRLGRPEEVASVVKFLASEEASYINGTVVQVNGGLYS